MENKPFQYDVFLSYARADDEPFVKRLYGDLTKKGKKVWWDRECMPARELTFYQEIIDAIEASERFIAVIGPNAVKSQYVKAEWYWAKEFGRGLVAILRDKKVGNYDIIPKQLQGPHCEDFASDDEYEYHFKRLIQNLEIPLVPAGELSYVPILPPKYFDRGELLQILIDRISKHVTDAEFRDSSRIPFIIHGMGGIGKTVLASVLARTTKNRRIFYNGVVWVSVGKTPNILNKLISTGIALGDDTELYNDENIAVGQLSKFMADKSTLIILDDVWEVEHVEPFLNSLGLKCRLILTSRIKDIIPGETQSVTELNKEQSIQYISHSLGIDPNTLPNIILEILNELNGHIFGLSQVISSRIEGKTPWEHILEALQERDMEFMKKRFPNYKHVDLLRMTQVSVDFLEEDIRTYYVHLAVFEDTIFPESTAIALLCGLHGLKERKASQVLVKLSNFSLLSLKGKYPDRAVVLHDLHYDYVSLSISKEESDQVKPYLYSAFKQQQLFNFHHLNKWKEIWGGTERLLRYIKNAMKYEPYTSNYFDTLCKIQNTFLEPKRLKIEGWGLKKMLLLDGSSLWYGRYLGMANIFKEILTKANFERYINKSNFYISVPMTLLPLVLQGTSLGIWYMASSKNSSLSIRLNVMCKQCQAGIVFIFSLIDGDIEDFTLSVNSNGSGTIESQWERYWGNLSETDKQKPLFFIAIHPEYLNPRKDFNTIPLSHIKEIAKRYGCQDFFEIKHSAWDAFQPLLFRIFNTVNWRSYVQKSKHFWEIGQLEEALKPLEWAINLFGDILDENAMKNLETLKNLLSSMKLTINKRNKK